MKCLAWLVLLGVLLSACSAYRIEDASIDRVDLEPKPRALAVKVVVFGVLRNGCTRVGEVEQHRENKTFLVTIKTIYARPVGTGCTQAVSEFREEISLNVADLESGAYAVNVNGVINTFTFPLEARYKVRVETVEVALLESLPVQVVATASGSLRSGCKEIAEASQRFESGTFFVTVLGSFPAGVSCTPVALPFSEQVTLEATDLGPGTYKVDVNGIVETFTLP